METTAAIDIIDKIGTEVVFLENTYDECFVKITLETYFIKFPGQPERETSYQNEAVVRAIAGGKEITESQYESA